MTKKGKFRRWLIKKLGGYTSPTVLENVVAYDSYRSIPVTFEAKSYMSNSLFLRDPEGCEERMRYGNQHELLTKVLEENENGELIKTIKTDVPEMDGVMFKSYIRLLPYHKYEE